jgi:hypothetical protein
MSRIEQPSPIGTFRAPRDPNHSAVLVRPACIIHRHMDAARGAASIIFSATASSRRQLVAPLVLRGRMMSVYQLLFAGTTPKGMWCCGRRAL